MKRVMRVMSGLVMLASLTGGVEAGATLDQVRSKGFVQCGVSDGLPGFSVMDAQGHYRGLDADFCRAVAAAVLGDAQKVQFTPLSAEQRFAALADAEVDLLVRHSSWVSSVDGGRGLSFTGILYFDGQGFLLGKARGVARSTDLAGADICVQAGTTSELNLAEYFHAQGLRYTPITYDSSEESARALQAGRCVALSSDQSQLHAQRLRLAQPDDYLVLPEVISKEPLGPLVRDDDAAWFDIVRWTLFALLNAEELGLDAGNVQARAAAPESPEQARLLGVAGDYGKDLQLPADWALQIVRQLGNYGELFERNLGSQSPLRIERGLNRLWSHGGLHYAPPVR